MTKRQCDMCGKQEDNLSIEFDQTHRGWIEILNWRQTWDACSWECATRLAQKEMVSAAERRAAAKASVERKR